MAPVERASFDCRRCGRRVAVPTWSRYVGPELCPRCYRTMAAQLAAPIVERFNERRASEPEPEMPPW